MKTQYNQNKIKKDYNVNYSNQIYPRTNINYDDSNQEENSDYQNEEEYEQEQDNSPHQQYFHPQRGQRARTEFYDEENYDEGESNNNYQRNREGVTGYYKSVQEKKSNNQKSKNSPYYNDFNIVKKNEEISKKYKYGDRGNSFQERSREEQNGRDLKYAI